MTACVLQDALVSKVLSTVKESKPEPDIALAVLVAIPYISVPMPGFEVIASHVLDDRVKTSAAKDDH